MQKRTAALPAGAHAAEGPCTARRFIAIGAALAMVILGGCVMRVAYTQLDWLALRYADRYLDLEGAQQDRVREMLVRQLAWHRSTQLPEYARFLHELRRDITGVPLTPDRVAFRYEQTVRMWDGLIARSIPDLATVLASLSEQQVVHLSERLERQNREFEEEFSGATAEARLGKRNRAAIRAFRRFTGRLDDNQEATVTRHMSAMHDLSAQWIVRRREWQKQFLDVLTRRSSPTFALELEALFLDPDQFDSPDYRAQVRENQQRAFRMVAETLNGLTPKQSAHLDSKLKGYARDLEILSAGASEEGASAREEGASARKEGKPEDRGAEERT